MSGTGMFSDAEICEGVTAGISREFPMLWNLACEFDFAERLGGCTDPLRREADAALRELWMARSALADPVVRVSDRGVVEGAAAYLEGEWVTVPAAEYDALVADREALLEHIRQLETITTEWLAETDDADGDDTTIHDFYVAVGAKWGKGNYYRRFKQLLGGGGAARSGGDA